MKRVLCIADSCCDLVFGGMPRIPKLGEELYAEHFSVQAGGGANTPVRLGRLGVPTTFWTVLGTDFAGQNVLRELNASGVRLAGAIVPGARTPVSAVLSTAEDRAFASVACTAPLAEDLAALEKAISDADIVHTYLGYCTRYPIIDFCRRHGSVLSVDCSFMDMGSRETDRLLSGCDYWKGNELEAMHITGADSPEDALKTLLKLVRRGVVITLGKQGSIGCEKGGTIIRQAAVECGAFRDSCGAGDAYAAGFLAGIASGEPFPACMERGSMEAGKCVAQYGGCAEKSDSVDA